MAYQLAAKNFKPSAINRVILLTDGEANVGATGPDSILQTIHDQRAQGVLLSTVGFGMGDYNDPMLERLADAGNGNYAYVDTLDAARRIFVQNLTGTLQVIAKDAKVQVDFNPAVVASYRLIGYDNRAVADADFRNDSVDAGEVGAGHSVTALYELRMTGQGQGTALTVQLRYADARAARCARSPSHSAAPASGAISPRLRRASSRPWRWPASPSSCAAAAWARHRWPACWRSPSASRHSSPTTAMSRSSPSWWRGRASFKGRA